MPLKSKQPRVAPLEPPFDREAAEVLDLLGPPMSLFRVVARQPELARGIYGFGSYYLSRKLNLSLRQRELVILRTTARCGADYEWGVHVAWFAEKAGLTTEQISSLAGGGPGDACWPEDADRAVTAAVDDLLDQRDLDDGAWARLVAGVGEGGALDVLFLTGWYQSISYTVRALRLPQEDGAPTISACA
jgi:alkylhydroperoxidase family enzyme